MGNKAARHFCHAATLLLLGACASVGGPEPARLRPVRLRCEYLENPLGIDVPRPRLSWTLESEERGQKQTAYQILVSSTREEFDRPDLWDSGKVASEESVHIPYGGKDLASERVKQSNPTL
jgi:alpha-L-rhamnosidase